MTYSYTASVDNLRLRTRVRLKVYGGWITGKVIELALLGDDMADVRITLELDGDKTVRSFDRPRTDLIGVYTE